MNRWRSGYITDRVGATVRQGVATANFIIPPERQRSPNTRSSLDAVKSARRLDDAGWKPGADGMRNKGGRRLAVQLEAANSARAVGRGIVTAFSGWHVDTAHLHDLYRES